MLFTKEQVYKYDTDNSQSDALSQKVGIVGAFKNCLKTENTYRYSLEIEVQGSLSTIFFVFSYSCGVTKHQDNYSLSCFSRSKPHKNCSLS